MLTGIVFVRLLLRRWKQCTYLYTSAAQVRAHVINAFCPTCTNGRSAHAMLVSVDSDER